MLGEPTYIGIFPGYLGMELIFADRGNPKSTGNTSIF